MQPAALDDHLHKIADADSCDEPAFIGSYIQHCLKQTQKTVCKSWHINTVVSGISQQSYVTQLHNYRTCLKCFNGLVFNVLACSWCDSGIESEKKLNTRLLSLVS